MFITGAGMGTSWKCQVKISRKKDVDKKLISWLKATQRA